MEIKDWAPLAIAAFAAFVAVPGALAGWKQWREKRSLTRLEKAERLIDVGGRFDSRLRDACLQAAEKIVLGEFLVPPVPRDWWRRALDALLLLVFLALQALACVFFGAIFLTFPGDGWWALAIRASGVAIASVGFIVTSVLTAMALWTVLSNSARVRVSSIDRLEALLDTAPEKISIRK